MVLPYVINRKLIWNGKDELMESVFPHKDDGNWRLMMIRVRDVIFYVSFSYSCTRDAFIIYILLGDTVQEAERYKAKIWIESSEADGNKNKIGFLQHVVSVEETHDMDGDLPNSKFLVIPYEEMKNFFVISKNDNDPMYPEEIGKWTVIVPVLVEDILNVT